MTFKPTGRREQKLQVMNHDMDNILAYLTSNGPTSRDELQRQCKISTKQISNRLKKLQNAGKIQSIRYGSYKDQNRDIVFGKTRYGALWALGKQEKVTKFRRERDQKRTESSSISQLSEFPPLLQKWLGFMPGFEPGIGRHIQETMPDIPLSRAKHHIGCGTQFMIGELASL